MNFVTSWAQTPAKG